MRRVVWGALAAGLLAVPMLAEQSIAQFTAPTDAELKMTADAKAPGADAVILDHDESSDDVDDIYVVHVRIKVLTEKGKELATIRTPYTQYTFTTFEAQGRTIHADGTIIPLADKAKELTDFKTKGLEVNSMVFNLPSVEVGSILEYWIKVRYGSTDKNWEIQEHHFVHHAHYSFRPGNWAGVMYATRIATGVKPEFKKGVYTLDIQDVPPIPDEDWMPPLNSLRWQVVFYYTYYKDGKEFWDTATKNWAKWVEEFSKPTGTLKKAVAELVLPGDSEEQKAQKIYDAVEKLDNTEFSRTKTHAERKKEKLKDIKKAEDVWKQRSGTKNELALLYVAMARAAELKVTPMQVVNRNRAIWDSSVLTTEQMDDFIVIASLGGKQVMLDPGEKMCPFGMLHWKHTLASGFRMKDDWKDAALGTTPAGSFRESMVQRTAYLVMDEEGKINGTVRFMMTGSEALYWRQLALGNDEDEVKKQFNEWVRGYVPAGIEADFDHFLGMEDAKSTLAGVVKVNGALGTATGKRFFVPGMFFESNAAHPFVALDKRETPIDVEYPRTAVDDVTYKLPAGYALEGAAPAADIKWPGFAALVVTPTATGDTIRVARTLAYNFVLLAPSHYPDLHGFYQKVATDDQQQLVLIRAAAVKGN